MYDFVERSNFLVSDVMDSASSTVDRRLSCFIPLHLKLIINMTLCLCRFEWNGSRQSVERVRWIRVRGETLWLTLCFPWFHSSIERWLGTSLIIWSVVVLTAFDVRDGQYQCFRFPTKSHCYTQQFALHKGKGRQIIVTASLLNILIKTFRLR